jgi:hypothetical protein
MGGKVGVINPKFKMQKSKLQSKVQSATILGG